LFNKISKQINKIKKIGIRKRFKKHILGSKQIGPPSQASDLFFFFFGWKVLAQPDNWQSSPNGYWNKRVTRLVTVHACVNYSRMLCTVTG
jgi:hypothetical protein